MKQSPRIYLAHGNQALRTEIRRMLTRMGYKVPFETDAGRSLISQCDKSAADLLVAGLTLSDMDGIEALITCGKSEPIPSIIIAEKINNQRVEDALHDHVMACLSHPVDESELRATITLVLRRFEEFQELRKENQELKTALEQRKWIERAKGLLMKQKGLDEEQAYLALRKMANDRRKKMIDVAVVIVEANDMLTG